MIMVMENREPRKNFSNLRVLSLESRRGTEMAKLIENYGGKPMVAPSMREVPVRKQYGSAGLCANSVRRRIRDGYFFDGRGNAGAGTRRGDCLLTRRVVAQLAKVAVVARGPKPAAVLREWNVPIAVTAPEPNTWREVLRALDANVAAVPLKGRKIAVQEYGVSNDELLAGLAERGANVTRVPVYEWALPEDTGPLRAAISAIAGSEIDVILFTTATQADHLLKIATEMKMDDAVRGALFVWSLHPLGPRRAKDSENTESLRTWSRRTPRWVFLSAKRPSTARRFCGANEVRRNR